MGSSISSNHLNTSESSSSTNSNERNCSDESTQSDIYIKDKFRLDFLDCNCCCDTTKKVANCDFQGINILQNIYDMIVIPEYKLNCRCSCDGDKNETIKFGLTTTPDAHAFDLSCPTSSDSGIKQ